MSTNSLVSVIIPAYNAEAYIHHTLDSVLGQTYPHFEVIVVDDGSRDRTAEIVRSYVQRDARIRLLQQQNAGVCAARNLAIENAQGVYIAPLDADDIWLPENLEKQVACIEAADPTVGVVYALSVDIDEAGNILGRYSAEHMHGPEGNVLVPLICSYFLNNGSSALFRRECIDQVGGYKTEGCEDWDLFLRIAERYQFRCVPEFLIGYRRYFRNPSSKSARMAQGFEVTMADVRQRNPDIPEIIYHWSASNFYNYIAGKSCIAGDYRGMLRWFFRGLQVDAALLLQPGIYKAIPLAMLKIVFQPITGLIWRDHQAWIEFKQRLKPEQKNDGIPLQDIALSIDPHPSVEKRYHQILRSRQNRILEWGQTWNKQQDLAREVVEPSV